MKNDPYVADTFDVDLMVHHAVGTRVFFKRIRTDNSRSSKSECSYPANWKLRVMREPFSTGTSIC